MGVRNFSIVLDSPTNSYYAGSNVTGRVHLTSDKQIQVRGLRIKFHGFANVSWRKRVRRRDREGHSRHRTVRYSAHEEYFSNRFYLIGSENGSIEIPAGDHNYPFSMTLPQNLPTSFESKRGHVRYTVRATLDLPWKLDQEVSALFQVHAPLDLNKFSTSKEPVKRETSKNFCCCWCRSGPLTLVMYVPHSGFVPGQDIPLTVEVDNASNVKVEAVKATINKVETYTAHSPKHDTKIIRNTIMTKNLGEVEINGSKTFSNAIKVPEMPFINLKSCSFINVDFFLKVEACVSGACTINLSEKIHLLIGSIPINGSQNESNFSSFDANSGMKNYNTIPSGLPPPPLGFHFGGIVPPSTAQNYNNPIPPQYSADFNTPYSPPLSDGTAVPNVHSTMYPQPIYPDLKVNFSYPGGSVVDITRASAPPIESESDSE